MIKKLQILVCALLMAGCTRGKSQFYEFDGGMLNLDQVSVIKTAAVLTVSVAPRGEDGAWGSDARQLYQEHAKFCQQSISNEVGYNGVIPGSKTALAEFASKISANITTDVLDTCAITVKAVAEIVFDAFTITQEEGSYVLPVGSETGIDKEGELAKVLSKLIEENVSEPADWETTYSELQSKISL